MDDRPDLDPADYRLGYLVYSLIWGDWSGIISQLGIDDVANHGLLFLRLLLTQDKSAGYTRTNITQIPADFHMAVGLLFGTIQVIVRI